MLIMTNTCIKCIVYVCITQCIRVGSSNWGTFGFVNKQSCQGFLRLHTQHIEEDNIIVLLLSIWTRIKGNEH